MISVNEALAIVCGQAKRFGTERVNLLDSLGRVLAQPIIADRDFPPFDRATMDGVAVNSAAVSYPAVSLKIEAVQAAGSAQLTLTSSRNCIEIMTGAMLPVGTDAIIPYEDISINNGFATVEAGNIRNWQNVHLQGTDMKAGETIVNAGALITPGVISTLASVGCEKVSVFALPRVAVCSTGDELIDTRETPLPHQVRRSNNYMLMAGLMTKGIKADSRHLPDDPQIMEAEVEKMMAANDVILFSGAVSKGKFDFVPQVCINLGMQVLFHGIAQRPGKPLLFGKFPNGTLVFGLPGNPVSTWVCYQVYFKRWLCESLGLPLKTIPAALGHQVIFKPSLTRHLMVSYRYQDNLIIADEVDMSTSGDLVALTKAEGLLSLPANEDVFPAGKVFNTQPF